MFYKLLRHIVGKTISGRIRDDSIRQSWVEPIVEKMMKSRLRWFGHVWRRHVNSVVRKVD